MVRKPFGIATAAAALGAISYHLPLHVTSAAAAVVPPGSDAAVPEPEGDRRRLAECGGLGWHASHPANDGCTDDDHYHEGWTRPGLVDNFFHGTVEECCAFFFRGGACKRYPTACGAAETDPPTAAATARPTPATARPTARTDPPTRPPQAPVIVPVAHSTRPPTRPPQASEPSAPAIGPTTFGGGGGGGGGGASGVECMWHPDLEEKDGCSNSNNFPPEWLRPGIKERMFHSTAEECCSQVYKTSSCKHYPKACGAGGGGYVGGGTTPTRPSPDPPAPAAPAPRFPTQRPTPVLRLWLQQTSGTCIDFEEEKPPSWVRESFPNYPSCCETSWDRDKCMAAVPEREPEPPGASFYPVEGIGVCVDERKFPRPSSVGATFGTYSECCLLGTTDSDHCLTSYKEFYYDGDTGTCVNIDDPDNPPLAVSVTYMEYADCCMKGASKVMACLDRNPDEPEQTETVDVDPTEARPDPVWYLPYAGSVCVDEYDEPKPYYVKKTYKNYVNCCAREIEDVDDAKYCMDKEPTREPSAAPTFSPSTPWPTLTEICPEEYDPTATYVAGSEVHVDEVMYRCKPHPYTPYCNNEAFRPGNEESSVWEEAWTELFGCSREPSSRPSEAPSAHPTSSPTCEAARWHPGDIHRRICTNSPDYPALWDSPPLSETYFTDSADECCRKFYDNKRCRRRNVCD